MKVTAIIITYNRPMALEAVLKSLSRQLVMPDEVIIADDGSGQETADLVNKYKLMFLFNLKHVWQQDLGYRIAAIRNKAIRESTGDYLVFSDGDLIFHPAFFKDFRRCLKPGTACIGSRVFLRKEACASVDKTVSRGKTFHFCSADIESNRINAIRLPFFTGLSPTRPYSRKLRGGLLGILKNDILAVNGWNESFTGWGLEDSELLARLYHYGIRFRKIKFAGITYHLWHEKFSRELLSENRLLLENTIHNRLVWCANGLVRGESS